MKLVSANLGVLKMAMK